MTDEHKTLDDSYLHYPQRSYGMDHSLYDWSMLTDRKAVTWKNDAKVAVWVNLNLQFFPLNQAKTVVPVPGGMKMPYPDLRHFSLRDYGNRIGVYRIFDALDKYNIEATIAINGTLVDRAAYLMDMIKERGHDLIGHGWQMDHLHTGDIDKAEETEWVSATIDKLANRFQKPIRGWLSPGRLQTVNTANILADSGIDYLCDWVNDDMPYAFRTETKSITAMPLSNELDDFFIIGSNLHSEDSYAQQAIDAFDMLYAEAEEYGGRMLALNIHPWLMGQPHRIASLERIFSHINSKTDVWSASATEIHECWQDQQ